MSFLYSSISPQYLEYIASNYTRAQIEADPSKCHLLEDPYIKDNMELAIRANEAKKGDFPEKKEFVQYFFCNGPELEAQTILYYRKEILSNPEYAEIARTYYSNIEVVRSLRSSTYNKETSSDNGNCFTDPCNYLGPFSDVVGIIGNPVVVKTNRNTMAKFVKWCCGDKKGEKPEMVSKGSIRENSEKNLPKTVRDDYRKFNAHSLMLQQDFYQTMNTLTRDHAVVAGDNSAIDDAEKIQDAVSLGTYSTLGDCAKLFAYAKGYTGNDARMNKQLSLSAPTAYKWPHGVRQTIPNPTVESDAAPPANLPDNSGVVSDGKFIDSDQEMIFKWGVSGALLTKEKIGEDEKDVVYVHDKNDNDGNRKAGRPSASTPSNVSPEGATVYTCPYTLNHFEGTGALDAFAEQFYVGAYVGLENVKEYFRKYHSSIDDATLGTLYSNGLIWAKIRLGIHQSSNVVQAAILNLQVLGSCPNLTLESTPLIHIDPAIVAKQAINGNKVALCASDDDSKMIGTNINISRNPSDGTIDSQGYGVKNLKLTSTTLEDGTTVQNPDILCGKTYKLINGSGFNDARVRFYVRDKEKAMSVITSDQPASLFDAGIITTQYINLTTMDVSSSGGLEKVIKSLITAYETGGNTKNMSKYGPNEYGFLVWGANEPFPSYGFMNTNRGQLRNLLNNYYLPNCSDQHASYIKQYMGKDGSGDAVHQFNSWANRPQNDAVYSELYKHLREAGTTIAMQDAQTRFFWAANSYGGNAKAAAAKRKLDLPLAIYYCCHAENGSGSGRYTYKRVDNNTIVKAAREKYENALKNDSSNGDYITACHLEYQKAWCNVFPDERQDFYDSLIANDNKLPAGHEEKKDYYKNADGWRNVTKSWKNDLGGNYYLAGIINIPSKGVSIQGIGTSSPGEITSK